MRPSSLSNPLLVFTICVAVLACGRKGDPVPRPRTPAGPVEARMDDLRRVIAVLPSRDKAGQALPGVELVRVIYLPLGLTRPAPEEVFSRGEVVLERRRPDLPGPGERLVLDLRSLRRPQGWIVLVAVRLGNVPGAPSEVLPWMDSSL